MSDCYSGLSTYGGTLNHPDGDRCDLEFCQRCGLAFDPANHGWYIDQPDLEGNGDNARLFREDAENFGDWQGFEEEDVGPWCDSCSWVLQRRRTA